MRRRTAAMLAARAGSLRWGWRGGRIGAGRFGGESVFVPWPGATEEDDGYLMSYVYDASAGTSELVILDAGAVEEEPVARVLIPARIPYGFHGAWVGA